MDQETRAAWFFDSDFSEQNLTRDHAAWLLPYFKKVLELATLEVEPGRCEPAVEQMIRSLAELWYSFTGSFPICSSSDYSNDGYDGAFWRLCRFYIELVQSAVPLRLRPKRRIAGPSIAKNMINELKLEQADLE